MAISFRLNYWFECEVVTSECQKRQVMSPRNETVQA